MLISRLVLKELANADFKEQGLKLKSISENFYVISNVKGLIENPHLIEYIEETFRIITQMKNLIKELVNITDIQYEVRTTLNFKRKIEEKMDRKLVIKPKNKNIWLIISDNISWNIKRKIVLQEKKRIEKNQKIILVNTGLINTETLKEEIIKDISHRIAYRGLEFEEAFQLNKH